MVQIIGVSGYLASGKDSLANYLVEKKGFSHISLSDILREDLKYQGKPVTRKNLQEIGNKVRKEYGDGVLAERALGKMVPSKNYVVTSIGRVAEIKALKKHPGFVSVFTVAPARKRFEWIRARKREEDPQTWKEFLKHEKLESKGGKAMFREFENCRKASDIIISNNSSLQAFFEKVDKMLIDIYKRPDWDEYFFNILESVSSRGTCDRGRAGSVIVRDNRILATGYVGSPPGLPHCDEAGHLMHKTIHEDGRESWHRVRTTHAEQNAIVQAAKHGVSMKDATIYAKFEPCLHCAKIIISAGITKVVCKRKYHAARTARKFFKMAGVQLIVKEDVVEKYAKQ